MPTFRPWEMQGPRITGQGVPWPPLGRGSMVLRLFRRSANRQLIDRLSGEIVAAARDPVLFTEYGIDDSLEGRFEAVTLHAVLVLRRLNRIDPPAPEIARDLTDAIFRSFEIALREMGVGDISVPKRMKTIAGAFLGRAAAYDMALRGARRRSKPRLRETSMMAAEIRRGLRAMWRPPAKPWPRRRSRPSPWARFHFRGLPLFAKARL